MKKLLLSVLTVLFVISAPLSAFEWGGVIKDETGITTPDFSNIIFNQSNAVSLWVKTPLGADSGFNLSAEAMYKYNLAIAKGSMSFENIADLNLLKVAGSLTVGDGLLSLSAGRFSTTDATGAVIAQTADGLYVDYALNAVKLGVYAGYTGLVNSLNVSMGVSPEKENKIYNMAYAYAPMGLSVAFPSLFLNQNLTIQGYGFLDCTSNKNNLFYGNLVLAGPFSNSIYYNLATSVGSANFKTLMNYSAFTLYVFATDAVSVTGGVEFGSANQGSLSAFTSVSAKSLEVSSNIIPNLGFTFGTDVLCLDLGAKLKVTYAGDKYKVSGTEADVDFVYNIFSDFQVGLNVNAFIDLTEAKANNYTAKLNIALAF